MFLKISGAGTPLGLHRAPLGPHRGAHDAPQVGPHGVCVHRLKSVSGASHKEVAADWLRDSVRICQKILSNEG